MYLPIHAVLVFAAAFLFPSATAGACTYAQKVAGIQHEIDTISSHSFIDASKIPLAPHASRTFFVTPNEPPRKTVKVNVGTSATSVRAQLVGLATFLNARVPEHSVHYTRNANGSVTSDFIQVDRIALPRVHVREIHDFNSKCQITKIKGFVHGTVACPANPDSLRNPVLIRLCAQLAGGA